MDPKVAQGFRMHSALANLNSLDVDRLDDADRKRIEKATTLLENVSVLTRPGDSEAGDGQVKP
jgi:hypothetical protein